MIQSSRTSPDPLLLSKWRDPACEVRYCSWLVPWDLTGVTPRPKAGSCGSESSGKTVQGASDSRAAGTADLWRAYKTLRASLYSRVAVWGFDSHRPHERSAALDGLGEQTWRDASSIASSSRKAATCGSGGSRWNADWRPRGQRVGGSSGIRPSRATFSRS